MLSVIEGPSLSQLGLFTLTQKSYPGGFLKVLLPIREGEEAANRRAAKYDDAF